MSSRDPYLPPGWTRQMMQLPTTLASILRGAVAEEGYGGVKAIGTAAVAMYLGAPPAVREALMEYVLLSTRRDPNNVDIDRAWAVVEQTIRAGSQTHRVDRILDPEVTPRPGAKASDRARRKTGS